MGQGQQGQLSEFLDESQVLQSLMKTESPYHETELIQNPKEGPVVIKNMKKITSDQEHHELHGLMKRIHAKFDTEKLHPNILQYYRESPARVNKTTRMLRQYICYNLQERIIWLPHLLTKAEKTWLIYQLLCATAQIHLTGAAHGDIKPDNVLITSYDWLYLADIHPYKPVLLNDGNLQEYNTFFGYLDNNTRIYTAPERWRSSNEVRDENAKLSFEMDVFSVGCVIAEIMMDGLPLFDLAKLQQLRRNLYNPLDELQKRVEDPEIIQLIMQMVDRDPKARPTITKCLEQWNAKVFPLSYGKVLFHLGASFQRIPQLYSDNKISLIRYHFDSICETALGIHDFSKKHLKQPIEPAVYNFLKSANQMEIFDQLQPSQPFFQASASPDQMQQRLSSATRPKDQDALLIVALWLGKLLTSAFYPQSKLVALEMIEVIAQYIPFQTRLNYILPLIVNSIERLDQDQVSQTKKGSSINKVKVRVLEVVLNIFSELLRPSCDEITIEPLDYTVAGSYIIPLFKKQLDAFKGDSMVRLAIARNLGKLTRLAVRLLEISIGSATRRRKEIINLRNEKQNNNISRIMSERSVSVAHRQSIAVMRRDEVMAEQDITVIPGYDYEIAQIWDEVDQIIHGLISDGQTDTPTMIAMLDSLVELAQIFGHDKCDFLIQQCLSCFNSLKDYRVKMQVIKTLMGMAVRIGQRKVEELVLPLVRELLEDTEDMVILENIKLVNFLVEKGLIKKQSSLELLECLVPFCFYPNPRIRFAVCTFVHLLSPARQAQIFAYEKTKAIDEQDFFCFVRPKLITFFREKYYFDITNNLDSPIKIHDRLKDPLSLRVMRQYFLMFKDSDNQHLQDQFTSRCSPPLSDGDIFAFNALLGIFSKKLLKMRKEDNKQEQPRLELQERYADQVYRVIKQASLCKLAGAPAQPVLQNQTSRALSEAQSIQLVQLYADEEDRKYSLQTAADATTNYGLNQVIDPQLQLRTLPFEMNQILMALNIVPQVPETQTFKNIVQRENKHDVSRFLRINSKLQMAPRAAQPSLVDQFDYQAQIENEVKVDEKHKKRYSKVNEPHAPQIKPQGTLMTTLFEHENPVNTVTVTDDQNYFMTGSRLDKQIHIWKVQNIQDDIRSKAHHTLTSGSPINQICMLQNSEILASATDNGIDLYDLNRVINHDKNTHKAVSNDNWLKIQSDEVQKLQSMQSPISYQNLLIAAKPTSGLMLYDLRSQRHAITDGGVFSGQGGAVSAMCIGKDAFTLTLGTLGGHIATYDIRYGVVSALYMHHLNWPVLALQTYRRNGPQKGDYNLAAIVSMGGPQHELCQLDIETGQVNTLFRLQQQPTGSSTITKAEIPNVPEFYRESKFKDRKFSTLKRDTYLGLFNRSLLNTHSSSFTSFINQEGMRNYDEYYMRSSTERFARFKEAYTSPNACRSILLPRDNFQSLMFDNETSHYCITGGNDRKIRYWNLVDPESQSYQVNSAMDDEVLYMKETIQKGTKIVVEKPVGQKDFPKMTTSRVKDQISTTDKNATIKGKSYVVKYAENTAYHNTMASIVQGKAQQSAQGSQANKSGPTHLDWSHVQCTPDQGYIHVNTIGGTSQGQHLNNLAITPEALEDSTENRISDVVSHQDAILDMAICKDMLVSCGRDGLVKIWK